MDALRGAAARAPVPIEVEGEIGRVSREVEVAAYFCCSEALQNAVKHAGPGARVPVHVGMRGRGAAVHGGRHRPRLRPGPALGGDRPHGHARPRRRGRRPARGALVAGGHDRQGRAAADPRRRLRTEERLALLPQADQDGWPQLVLGRHGESAALARRPRAARPAVAETSTTAVARPGQADPRGWPRSRRCPAGGRPSGRGRCPRAAPPRHRPRRCSPRPRCRSRGWPRAAGAPRMRKRSWSSTVSTRTPLGSGEHRRRCFPQTRHLTPARGRAARPPPCGSRPRRRGRG